MSASQPELKCYICFKPVTSAKCFSHNDKKFCSMKCCKKEQENLKVKAKEDKKFTRFQGSFGWGSGSLAF